MKQLYWQPIVLVAAVVVGKSVCVCGVTILAFFWVDLAGGGAAAVVVAVRGRSELLLPRNELWHSSSSGESRPTYRSSCYGYHHGQWYGYGTTSHR